MGFKVLVHCYPYNLIFLWSVGLALLCLGVNADEDPPKRFYPRSHLSWSQDEVNQFRQQSKLQLQRRIKNFKNQAKSHQAETDLDKISMPVFPKPSKYPVEPSQESANEIVTPAPHHRSAGNNIAPESVRRRNASPPYSYSIYPTWRPRDPAARLQTSTRVPLSEAEKLKLIEAWRVSKSEKPADTMVSSRQTNLNPVEAEPESDSKTKQTKRQTGGYEFPTNVGIDGGMAQIPISRKGKKKDKDCNTTKMAPESAENPGLITGAEPVDGPRGKSLHGPTELLRRSFQPYFTCGRNTEEGIQACRMLCDRRDFQHFSCLEDFCYCQTSYTFHKPAHFESADTAPFFFCGRYDLEGYEKCVEVCKKKPMATVQCGGASCYCHFANSHLQYDANGNTIPGSNMADDESRTTIPNRIKASYCGRPPGPTPILDAGALFPFPDIKDKVNNCKYRCKGGQYACTKRFCYCTSSGVVGA